MKGKNYVNGGKAKGPGGPTDDKISAKVSNGEYVLPADTVSAIGVDVLDAIRAATHELKLADGGAIGLPEYSVEELPVENLVARTPRKPMALTEITPQRIDIPDVRPPTYPVQELPVENLTARTPMRPTALTEIMPRRIDIPDVHPGRIGGIEVAERTLPVENLVAKSVSPVRQAYAAYPGMFKAASTAARVLGSPATMGAEMLLNSSDVGANSDVVPRQTAPGFNWVPDNRRYADGGRVVDAENMSDFRPDLFLTETAKKIRNTLHPPISGMRFGAQPRQSVTTQPEASLESNLGSVADQVGDVVRAMPGAFREHIATIPGDIARAFTDSPEGVVSTPAQTAVPASAHAAAPAQAPRGNIVAEGGGMRYEIDPQGNVHKFGAQGEMPVKSLGLIGGDKGTDLTGDTMAKMNAHARGMAALRAGGSYEQAYNNYLNPQLAQNDFASRLQARYLGLLDRMQDYPITNLSDVGKFKRMKAQAELLGSMLGQTTAAGYGLLGHQAQAQAALQGARLQGDYGLAGKVLESKDKADLELQKQAASPEAQQATANAPMLKALQQQYQVAFDPNVTPEQREQAWAQITELGKKAKEVQMFKVPSNPMFSLGLPAAGSGG